MSKTLRVPKYRCHKPTGQVVVTLTAGTTTWNSAASKAEYNRLIGEWSAPGRCLPSRGFRRDRGRVGGCLLDLRPGLLSEGWPAYPVAGSREAGRPAAADHLRPDADPEAIGCRKYCNYLIDSIERVFKWATSQGVAPRDDLPGTGNGARLTQRAVGCPRDRAGPAVAADVTQIYAESDLTLAADLECQHSKRPRPTGVVV